MAIPPDDRRLSQRMPVLLVASYTDREDMLRATITNLSDGGLFIRTSRPLPIGTEVYLAIQLGSAPAIRQKGRVTWVRGHDEEGMGVRFVPPVDAQLAAMVPRDPAARE